MIDRILRSLPPFKGKHRLARFLLYWQISNGKEIIEKGKLGCWFKLPSVKENIGFEILINGIYEAETIRFVNKHLKTGDLFIDIGANIGAISIPVCKHRSDINAISLEAAPWIFNFLEENVKINKISNIILVNKVISDKDDSKVDFFSPRDKFGKGSLAPVFTSDAVKVETITLDRLAEVYEGKRIGLIKVDVEGFEMLVFKGGAMWLSHFQAPDILFKFVEWAERLAGVVVGSAQSVLQNFDYSLYHFENGEVGQRLTQLIVSGSCLIFATKGNLRSL